MPFQSELDTGLNSESTIAGSGASILSLVTPEEEPVRAVYESAMRDDQFAAGTRIVITTTNGRSTPITVTKHRISTFRGYEVRWRPVNMVEIIY